MQTLKACLPGNKKPPRHRRLVGFAGGSAGMAVSRYSPVALCRRLSTALLWAAYVLITHYVACHSCFGRMLVVP